MIHDTFINWDTHFFFSSKTLAKVHFGPSFHSECCGCGVLIDILQFKATINHKDRQKQLYTTQIRIFRSLLETKQHYTSTTYCSYIR